MAKYLWFVVNLDDGSVQGTNDTELVKQFVEEDSYVCIHNEGYYFNGDRLENTVDEIEVSDFVNDEVDPDDDSIPF